MTKFLVGLVLLSAWLAGCSKNTCCPRPCGPPARVCCPAPRAQPQPLRGPCVPRTYEDRTTRYTVPACDPLPAGNCTAGTACEEGNCNDACTPCVCWPDYCDATSRHLARTLLVRLRNRATQLKTDLCGQIQDNAEKQECIRLLDAIYAEATACLNHTGGAPHRPAGNPASHTLYACGVLWATVKSSHDRLCGDSLSRADLELCLGELNHPDPVTGPP